MADAMAGGELPTPAQMRSFRDASEAAWQARRMREVSRSVVTGNLAGGICLIGIMLVMVHSDRGGLSVPLAVTLGPPLACIAVMVASLGWWMKRRRANGLVTVVDRREEQARAAAVARPRRMVVIFASIFAFQLLCTIGWSVAFRRMTPSATLACLALGPVIGMVFFVRRFVLFRLWEDLLFAGCVALAYAPFFLQAWKLVPLAWNLTPVSVSSLALVAVGVACLHLRWVSWTRSLAGLGGEGDVEEAGA